MVTISVVNPIDHEQPNGAVVISYFDGGALSESDSSYLPLSDVKIDMAAVPLRSEDYPVLAAIWSAAEDDDIFTDTPAI